MSEQAEQTAPAPAAPGTGATVKDEAARQLVALAGGLVFIAAAVVVERAASDPDFARSLRMRAARAVEQLAGLTMRRAAEVADRAEQVYKRDCA